MNKSIQEMKEYIKEAGNTDENLPDDMVASLYNTIIESEKTVQNEETNRLINKSLDEEEIIQSSPSSCEMVPLEVTDNKKKMQKAKLQLKSPKKTNVNSNSNINNNNNDESEIKNDFILTERRKGTFSHPLLQSEHFLAQSVEKRFEMLWEYYEKQDKMLTELARRSLRPAPVPKPIQLPIIDENHQTASTSSNLNIDDENVSFSRAGRQIRKRKLQLYNELDEDIWERFETTPNRKSDDDDDNSEWLACSQSKRSCNKKTTKKNTENKTVESKSAKSRTDMIFDRLKAINVQEEKKSQEMDTFDKSIGNIDDNDLNGEDEMIVDEVESPSKSGVPSIVKRKAIERCKSPSKKEALPLRKERVQRKTAEQEKSISSNKKDEKFNSCPMCYKSVPQSYIQQHVEQCIESTQDKKEPPIIANTNFTSTISCPICDEVFLSNKLYESHKEKCLQN